jgi:hypothetical protein
VDALVRKKALRHAAKVAFGTMIVGCGGNETTTTDAAADVKSGDVQMMDVMADALADVTADSASDVATDASLMCTQEVALDASIDENTFQCCLGVVEQITGDSGFTIADAGGNPSIDNCCVAIVAHVDTMGDYSAAEPTLGTCCNIVGNPMGPACTPWGPPMPVELEAPFTLGVMS